MNGKHTTFHQINLHRSKYANFELFKQVEPLGHFIILAQEPHFYKGKLTGTPRGLKVHHTGQYSRSCIIHPKKLNIVSLPELCDRDVVSCLWEIEPNKQVMLISTYWDITLPNIPEALISSIEYCTTHNIPYICSMDSNAHSTLWGCNKNNFRGNTLEEYLLSVWADLLNKGSQTHFFEPKILYHKDITFPDASQWFSKW